LGKKNLVVITGPTAIGKTSLAIEVAKHFHTEIISADSRQFFREISIGTAKPSEIQLKEVKHHFINSHSIFDEYNVGKFEEDALKHLEKLFQNHNIVLLVGGSGLYIDGVCKGFDALPESDKETREKLKRIFEEEGIGSLQKLLKEKDPEHYEKVDLSNPHRIMRALEVCMSTGKKYSELRKGEKKKRKFNVIKIGLNTERKKLYKNINVRVDGMFKAGLLEEAKKLEPNKNLNSLQTVGYKELFDFIGGKITFENAVELIKKNTRNFAKRQLTWFRKDKEITWFDPNEKENILNYIESRIIHALL
jgi:tRNA dimethylallyltransferase